MSKIDMTNPDFLELKIVGRRLLRAHAIGPECAFCEEIASDVIVIRELSVRMEVSLLPICDRCKLPSFIGVDTL